MKIVRLALLVLLAFGPSAAARPARVVHITARRFEFAPKVLELKVGEPVVLELSSLDRKHGFSAPDLHVEAVILPGQITRIRLVPDRAGTFTFHCSVFCGGGHEEMTGQVVVTP